MVSKFVTYSGWTLYYGLSTDELPKDVPNGSRFTAIDTDDEYWYDRENQGWYDADGQFIPDNEEEGDEDVMFVEFTVNLDDSITCEKTIEELVTLIEADKQLIAKFPSPDGVIYYAQLAIYHPAVTSPPYPHVIVFDVTIQDIDGIYVYGIAGNDSNGDSWVFTSELIKEFVSG